MVRLTRALPLILAAAGCAAQRAPGPQEPPAPGTHRIAAVQYEIKSGRTWLEVAAHVEAQIDEAAAAGAELIVLPELFVFDVWPAEIPDEKAYVRALAREVTPKLLARLGAAARDRQISVLVGSVPELRDGRLYNTAHLLFADGRDARQDKVYLTAWGKKMGMTPGAGLEVFDAPWGRTVVLVCYDIEIPALSHFLAPLRPEILLVPSMTESEHGLFRVRWVAQARAVEHHAYVVVASTVGRPNPTWAHFGQAVFLTPRDEGFVGVLAQGPRDTPAIVFADLDLEQLRTSRASVSFYPAKDQAAAAAAE